MKFNLNNTEYKYPTTLAEITLRQRIAFYNLHEKQRVIPEDEVDAVEANVLFALEQFAFYTGIPVDVVKQQLDLGQVLDVVTTSAAIMQEEEQQMQLESEYLFNNELWYIAAPDVTPGSKFTFNEFITSKQVVKQTQQLGLGNFEALPYLCAVYLRRADEQFTDELVDKRSEMFMDLPLSIALAVGFFLSDTISSWQVTSQSLSPEAEEELI